MSLLFSPWISIFRTPNSHHAHRYSNPTLSRVSFLIKTHAQIQEPQRQTDVVIIGAGLAGLAAANRLHSAKIPFLLFESSDAVGGRVRTDTVDGFLLDRGFQIFITGYPEAKKILDYESLNLQKFYSGALIYYNNEFHLVSDPFRHFFDSLKSLTNPIGSSFDKFLIGLSRLKALARSDDEILSDKEESIIQYLRNSGFSDSIIDRFFHPFFGGIFFDKDLETTSRLFNFIFKCLALGDNALPENGICEIPNQICRKLPNGSVILNSKVIAIDPPFVRLQNNQTVKTEHGVIVAVDEPEAETLLFRNLNIGKPVREPIRSTVCIYFTTDRTPPIREPVLILNGSGKGIVNNMFFATNVAASYGPPGKTLVSVSIIGLCEGISDEELVANVVNELSGWYGADVVSTWKHLRTYRIRYAQPNQNPPTHFSGQNPSVGSGIYLCGDYRSSATFDGALVSGRKAAEALLRERASIFI